jgi:predicted nucleic acid-binding protein
MPMSIPYYDFGTGHVPVDGNDVLFLDTNSIIAFLYEDHDFHAVTLCMITYALQQGALLCYSETSVRETLFVLARIYYIADRTHAFIASNNRDPNDREVRIFYKEWQDGLKNDPGMVKHYNELATEKLRALFFSPFLCLIPASEEVISEAFDAAIGTPPLVAGDALIVSSAKKYCTGIISLDGDLSHVSMIKMYSTTKKNDAFKAYAQEVIAKMGIEEVLLENLGSTEFNKKFGYIP